MNNRKKIAILPLRKGSKGIPGKNRKRLLGRPLYQWVLGEAVLSDLDVVYVFSDDDQLLEQVDEIYRWSGKVRTFKRSEESATDTASTEFGMQELAAAINYDFDLFCLLQATSPLLTSEDINCGLASLYREDTDSVLTVVEAKRFIWSKEGLALNYDFHSRPRRQDFDGLHIENGAFYGIKKASYMESKIRLGGKVSIISMPEESLHEIDEPADWFVIEQLLKNRLAQCKYNAVIKLLVLDVDGVFTPGNVGVSPEGELFKLFSLRDGMGLEVARESGIEVMVMTSEISPIVVQRMKKLKITDFHLGVKDKYTYLSHLLNQRGLLRSEVAYIGDDINDLANILGCGWGVVPVNAVPEMYPIADHILHASGGDLAIREAVHLINKINQRNKLS